MSITLHYFPNYGRAEVIRMFFHSQQIEFTNDTFEDCSEFLKKGTAEFGQVPVLDIDGMSLSESRAIERYLLTKSGIQTSTPYEGYLNDSTISFLEDIRNIIWTFIFVDNNIEGLNKWWETDMPHYLRLLNGRVNENNLFVGSTRQHADWAVFEFVWDEFLTAGKADKRRTVLEDNAPKLVRFAESFKSADERLRSYLESRPERPY